jgi:uncharacterized protein (TIGR02246 family)
MAVKDLLTALGAAVERLDADQLAELVHQDAVVRPVSADGATLDRAGYVEWMREAYAGVLRPTVHETRFVDEHTALLVGRQQFSHPGNGGLHDFPVTWLLVERDGLLWRLDHFSTVEEAEAALPGAVDETPA